MKLSLKVLLFLCGLVFFDSSYSHAQASPNHGRTREGKPYRIDTQGMRISDYIAELEVANDDLKRQLEASERELDEKNRLLQQTGTTRIKTEVCEKDLVNGSAERANCDQKIKELQSKLIVAEENAKAHVQPVCDFQSPQNPYKYQVEELQGKLKGMPDANVFEEERAKRDSLETELREAHERLNTAQVKLAAAQETADLAQKKMVSEESASKKEVPEESTKRAALMTPEKQPEQPETEVGSKEELRLMLKQIQQLIVERKGLLDSLKARGKAVSISLRPLVASGGHSLDSFRVEVENFSASTNVSSVRAGLNEIKAILGDDISVLRRLTQ